MTHKKKMRDLGAAERTAILVGLMEIHCPRSRRSTGESYEVIANKWVTKMPLFALKRRNFNIDTKEIQLNITELRKDFTYRYNNGKHWFDWFDKVHPLWIVIKRGNGIDKLNSMIYTTDNSINLIMNSNPDDILEAYYKSIDDIHTLTRQEVWIDIISLNNYIRQTTEVLNIDQDMDDAKRNKMFGNLLDAWLVFKLTQGYDVQYTRPEDGKQFWAMPQYYTHSPVYQRRTYRGMISIHSLSEIVRKSCVGEGYSLDLHASVWSFYKDLAIMLGMSSQKYSVITEYLDNKDSIRKRLAKNIQSHYNPISLVKQALTAIGFGASDKDYGGISDIIKNKDDRNRLSSDPLWIQLVAVSGDISDAVEAQVDRANWIDPMYDDLFYKNGNVKIKKFMAMLYQQYETKLMLDVIQMLEQNNEVVMWIHDGVYTRRRPDGYYNQIAKQHNPYAKFDTPERITPFQYTAPLSVVKLDSNVIDHRTRMQIEQWRAEGLDVTQVAWDDVRNEIAQTYERVPHKPRKLAGVVAR